MRQLRSATFAVPAIPESVGAARRHGCGTLASWQAAVDPDTAAAVQQFVTIGAGPHGAALHARGSGETTGGIAPWLGPLAAPETSARVLASGETRDILRGRVESYAAQEISACWSS